MKERTFRLMYFLIAVSLLIIGIACDPLVNPGAPASLSEIPESELNKTSNNITAGLNPVVIRLGDAEYTMRYQVVLKNEGPGIISRLLLRVALPSNRGFFQKVVLDEGGPVKGKKFRDEDGNVFAEIEFNNVDTGIEVPIIIDHKVVVSHLQFYIDTCRGDTIDRFLKPERWVESDNMEIVTKAKQITRDKTTPCAKARAIYDWIGDTIKYGGFSGVDKGALYCLQNSSGDCSEFSYLMIAMCRAVGIPARFVEGFTCEKNKVAISEFKHDWLDVYLPEAGWVPVDPTWGRNNINRDKYFARMLPDHIIMTVGNPQALAKWSPPFHYYEYKYWWAVRNVKVSFSEKLNIVPVK